MNFSKYQQLARRTEKVLAPKAALQHGMLGVITEAGELGDSIKRHVIYEQQLDVENCAEEIGDILWYLALLANNLGLSLENIARENIFKLMTRYPEKYTDRDAAERKDK